MSAPLGEVIISRRYDHELMRDRIHIDRADPKARIAGELLRQIAADECEPWVTITSERPLLAVTFADDYGQRFVYRIGERDPYADIYEMEWPD